MTTVPNSDPADILGSLEDDTKVMLLDIATKPFQFPDSHWVTEQRSEMLDRMGELQEFGLVRCDVVLTRGSQPAWDMWHVTELGLRVAIQAMEEVFEVARIYVRRWKANDDQEQS
jgi:hypothetical protein